MVAGRYEWLSPFEEAGRSGSGYLDVDFLTGTVAGGLASAEFLDVVTDFKDKLPGFCLRNGIVLDAFRRLEARYVSDPVVPRFVVTVEGVGGCRSVDEYNPQGARFRVLDPLGCIRCKRGQVVRIFGSMRMDHR